MAAYVLVLLALAISSNLCLQVRKRGKAALGQVLAALGCHDAPHASVQSRIQAWLEPVYGFLAEEELCTVAADALPGGAG